MKTIDHLDQEEKKHFIHCDCGEYIDMRDLKQVFEHLHAKNIPEPNWTYCVRVGEPVAYGKGRRIDLS